MDLAKLVVALGLAIFLSVFIGDFMALVYPIPTSSPSTLSNSCTDIISSKCGASSSVTDYTENYKCQSSVYASKEYKDCTADMQAAQKNLQSTYAGRLKTYQIVTLITYGLVGLILILLGFLIIKYRSIGSGFILGGVFVILISGALSTLFSLVSTFSGILSVAGGSLGKVDNSFGVLLQIMRILGEIVAIFLIILMSYLKLEKENSSSEGYQA